MEMKELFKIEAIRRKTGTKRQQPSPHNWRELMKSAPHEVTVAQVDKAIEAIELATKSAISFLKKERAKIVNGENGKR